MSDEAKSFCAVHGHDYQPGVFFSYARDENGKMFAGHGKSGYPQFMRFLCRHCLDLREVQVLPAMEIRPLPLPAPAPKPPKPPALTPGVPLREQPRQGKP